MIKVHLYKIGDDGISGIGDIMLDAVPREGEYVVFKVRWKVLSVTYHYMPRRIVLSVERV